MILYAPSPAPISSLDIVSRKSKDRLVNEPSEEIYGGYANARGETFLFARELVYRVNFKNRTIQQRPKLNPAAQARYDATQAGESFEYCNLTFRRLSGAEITEICGSGAFRVTPKLLN